MLDPDFLVSYCKRFGINYIPGYGFKTSEGVELNIYKPSDVGIEFLETLQEEKRFWLTLIMQNLSDMGYFIDPFEMMNKNKKEKLEEIELSDICKYFSEDEYTEEIETDQQFFTSVLMPLLDSGLVPIHRPTLVEAFEKLKGEEITLVNPNSFTELITNPYVVNVLFNRGTNAEVFTKCKETNTVLMYYGSGEWI
jgi:hypothetical protein